MPGRDDRRRTAQLLAAIHARLLAMRAAWDAATAAAAAGHDEPGGEATDRRRPGRGRR